MRRSNQSISGRSQGEQERVGEQENEWERGIKVVKVSPGSCVQVGPCVQRSEYDDAFGDDEDENDDEYTARCSTVQ